MVPFNEPVRFNHKEVAFREVGGEIGVLMRRGDLFELEGSGLFLFRQMLKRDKTCSDLAVELSEEYSVLPAEALNDVTQFVLQLCSQKILLCDAACPVVDHEGASHTNRVLPCKPASLHCWAYARRNLIPLKCKINITYRCNIACRFCYNGPRPGLPGPYPVQLELSLLELESILQQVRQAGGFILTVSGGEPFIRRDLTDILSIADDLGLAVEVQTNGTLITKQVAQDLSRHRLQLVVIPLFGANAETHDAFVRVPGAFVKACSGIQALREFGIEVGIRSAITRSNFREWHEVRALVARLGARYFPHVQVHLSSDGKVDLRRILRLSDREIAELRDEGLQINSDNSCEIGLARVDIMPNGDVALCSLLAEPFGNLRQQRFDEIWFYSSRLNQIRQNLQGGVRGCDIATVEGGCGFPYCRADSLWDDGELWMPSSEALRVHNAARN